LSARDVRRIGNHVGDTADTLQQSPQGVIRFVGGKGVATALGTTKHRVNKCDERLALGVVGEDGLQVVARAGEPAVLELAVALTRPRADARSTSEPRSEPVGVMPVADQPPTRCTKLRAHIRATR